MQPPAGNGIKAWAPGYSETPFCFEQTFEKFTRLVAWSGNPDQIQKAFYAIVGQLPEVVEILLKTTAGKAEDGEPLWSRHRGMSRRDSFLAVVHANVFFVFSDGAHQLVVKDPACEHYLAFDDHGILFVYEPTDANREAFRTLGFATREAELIHTRPHFQRASDDPTLQRQFISALGLLPTTRPD